MGKWLLYLMKIETSGLDQVTCSPASEVNPLRLPDVCLSKNPFDIIAQNRHSGMAMSISYGLTSPTSICFQESIIRQKREAKERKRKEAGGLQSLFGEKRKYKTLVIDRYFAYYIIIKTAVYGSR